MPFSTQTDPPCNKSVEQSKKISAEMKGSTITSQYSKYAKMVRNNQLTIASAELLANVQAEIAKVVDEEKMAPPWNMEQRARPKKNEQNVVLRMTPVHCLCYAATRNSLKSRVNQALSTHVASCILTKYAIGNSRRSTYAVSNGSALPQNIKIPKESDPTHERHLCQKKNITRLTLKRKLTAPPSVTWFPLNVHWSILRLTGLFSKLMPPSLLESLEGVAMVVSGRIINKQRIHQK